MLLQLTYLVFFGGAGWAVLSSDDLAGQTSSSSIWKFVL